MIGLCRGYCFTDIIIKLPLYYILFSPPSPTKSEFHTKRRGGGSGEDKQIIRVDNRHRLDDHETETGWNPRTAPKNEWIALRLSGLESRQYTHVSRPSSFPS